MGFEVLRNGLGIGAVLLHPEGQTLQSQIQDEGTLGRLDAAEVTHELGGTLGDEGTADAEALGIGNAVIALVRGAQAGEFIRVGSPVKLAAVHNGTADGRGVAVHVFGGGVGHDVRPPLKGTAVDGSGESVVHNQGHTMCMGRPGKLLNVQHRQSRIGNGFSEHGLGVGPESGVQLLLGAVRVHKGGFQAHPLHGHREQVKAAAVDGRAGHNVVAAAGNVEHRQEIGRLTGAGQHGGAASLQGADFRRHCVAGRIGQTGVEIAVRLQVEQLAHVLRSSIFERGALHNGNLAGFAVSGLVPSLNAQSFRTQFLHRKSPHSKKLKYTIHCNPWADICQ